MVVYRIPNWDEDFENNRTRELKHMDWVPIPNRMDGDGYTELVDHPDGAAHFGAWISLVQIASKCKPRGYLLRDIAIPQEGAAIPQAPADAIHHHKLPHDPVSLSRISRLPAEVFLKAIPRLVSIGWLVSEVVSSNTDTKIPQDGAGSSAQSRRTVRDSAYGTERNGTERTEEKNSRPVPDGTEGEVDPPGFVKFWKSYPAGPRKQAKAKCRREWQRNQLERIAETVIAALVTCKSSADWKRDGGQYIPMPLTWLNRAPWETDAAELAAAPEGANGDDDVWESDPDSEAARALDEPDTNGEFAP